MNSTDEVIQATLLGPDDYLFRKEQQRKRAPKVETPAIPDEPCCARCANWIAPEQGDEFGFGECGFLSVITSGTSKGRIISAEEARRLPLVPDMEPLRTKPYLLACGGYFGRAVPA